MTLLRLSTVMHHFVQSDLVTLQRPAVIGSNRGHIIPIPTNQNGAYLPRRSFFRSPQVDVGRNANLFFSTTDSNGVHVIDIWTVIRNHKMHGLEQQLRQSSIMNDPPEIFLLDDGRLCGTTTQG